MVRTRKKSKPELEREKLWREVVLARRDVRRPYWKGTGKAITWGTEKVRSGTTKIYNVIKPQKQPPTRVVVAPSRRNTGLAIRLILIIILIFLWFRIGYTQTLTKEFWNSDLMEGVRGGVASAQIFLKKLIESPADIAKWQNPLAEHKAAKKEVGVKLESVDVFGGPYYYSYDKERDEIVEKEIKVRRNIKILYLTKVDFGDRDPKLKIGCELEDYDGDVMMRFISKKEKEGVEAKKGFREYSLDEEKLGPKDVTEIEIECIFDSDEVDYSELVTDPNKKYKALTATVKVIYPVTDQTTLPLFIVSEEFIGDKERPDKGRLFFDTYDLVSSLSQNKLWLGSGKIASYSTYDRKGPMNLVIQPSTYQPFGKELITIHSRLIEDDVFKWAGELNTLKFYSIGWRDDLNGKIAYTENCYQYSGGELKSERIDRINKIICSKDDNDCKSSLSKNDIALPDCEIEIVDIPSSRFTTYNIFGVLKYDYIVKDTDTIKIEKIEEDLNDEDLDNNGEDITG